MPPMDTVNLAFEVPAGSGRLLVGVVRVIGWVVRMLYENPDDRNSNRGPSDLWPDRRCGARSPIGGASKRDSN